jgi:6,7-dimethyl-8-ribityllumazine synthase
MWNEWLLIRNDQFSINSQISINSYQLALKQEKSKININAKGRVAVIVADFNKDITDGLLEGLEFVFDKCEGVQWQVVRVPGAFEIPLKAQELASMMKVEKDGTEEQLFDVIVALGCVIKGDTYHFELVANECARGCMDVMLGMGVPVVFEVLATYDEEQAKLRSSGEHNHGLIAANVTMRYLEEK